MPRYRVYAEETTARLVSCVVEAPTPAAAMAAVEDVGWTEWAWQEERSEAGFEVCEDLTERLDVEAAE